MMSVIFYRLKIEPEHQSLRCWVTARGSHGCKAVNLILTHRLYPLYRYVLSLSDEFTLIWRVDTFFTFTSASHRR